MASPDHPRCSCDLARQTGTWSVSYNTFVNAGRHGCSGHPGPGPAAKTGRLPAAACCRAANGAALVLPVCAACAGLRLWNQPRVRPGWLYSCAILQVSTRHRADGAGRDRPGTKQSKMGPNTGVGRSSQRELPKTNAGCVRNGAHDAAAAAAAVGGRGGGGGADVAAAALGGSGRLPLLRLLAAARENHLTLACRPPPPRPRPAARRRGACAAACLGSTGTAARRSPAASCRTAGPSA